MDKVSALKHAQRTANLKKLIRELRRSLKSWQTKSPQILTNLFFPPKSFDELQRLHLLPLLLQNAASGFPVEADTLQLKVLGLVRLGLCQWSFAWIPGMMRNVQARHVMTWEEKGLGQLNMSFVILNMFFQFLEFCHTIASKTPKEKLQSPCGLSAPTNSGRT